MNTLIEPGLKPVPPRGDIFVLYCSHCFQQSSACISGGRGPRLYTGVTLHSHGPRKKARFKLVAILYTCFRSKYDVFSTVQVVAIGQFTAKKLRSH